MIPHIIIIPGLGDSGPDHWQSFWLSAFPDTAKLIQDNWDEPVLSDWLVKINDAISQVNRPTYIVAHSLGACLVIHWANRYQNPNIKGALLVAPANVDSPEHTPDVVRNFAPMPLLKLPFPSIVIASTNDPYMDILSAQHFAKQWGSNFVNIGAKGHINSDSKLQSWEEGQLLLKKLMSDGTAD